MCVCMCYFDSNHGYETTREVGIENPVGGGSGKSGPVQIYVLCFAVKIFSKTTAIVPVLSA